MNIMSDILLFDFPFKQTSIFQILDKLCSPSKKLKIVMKSFSFAKSAAVFFLLF